MEKRDFSSAWELGSTEENIFLEKVEVMLAAARIPLGL